MRIVCSKANKEDSSALEAAGAEFCCVSTMLWDWLYGKGNFDAEYCEVS